MTGPILSFRRGAVAFATYGRRLLLYCVRILRSRHVAVGVLLAFCATLGSAIWFHHVLEDDFEQRKVRHDSIEYLRDSLWLQHKLFGADADTLARHYAAITNKPGAELGCARVNSLFLSVQNAVVLQICNDDVQGVFWSNLLFFSLSVGLATYVVWRSAGIAPACAIAPALALIYDGAQIPTIMTEPMVGFWLVCLVSSAWATLRDSRAGMIALALSCLMATQYKAPLVPFCVLGAALLGARLGPTALSGRCGRKLSALVGLLVGVSLVIGVMIGTRRVMSSISDIPPDKITRSNAGYAFWMGSLPSAWTGAYAGRTSVATFNAMDSSECLEQLEVIRRYGIYYIPFRKALPLIWSNIVRDPLDRLACIAFRYTKLIGINPPASSFAMWIGALALLACLLAAFDRGNELLPWAVGLQGMLWIHAFSRYRGRDGGQIVVLIAVAACIGAAWIFRCALRLGRDGIAPRAMIPAWVRWPLVPLVVVPVMWMALVPDIRSGKPPALLRCDVTVIGDEADTLHVTATLDRAHIFTRFRSRHGCRVYRQTDSDGRVEFEIPLEAVGRLSKDNRVALEAWSKTGVRKGWYLLEYMASGEPGAGQTQPSESGRGE
jgi:hypothetical protein